MRALCRHASPQLWLHEPVQPLSGWQPAPRHSAHPLGVPPPIDSSNASEGPHAPGVCQQPDPRRETSSRICDCAGRTSKCAPLAQTMCSPEGWSCLRTSACCLFKLCRALCDPPPAMSPLLHAQAEVACSQGTSGLWNPMALLLVDHNNLTGVGLLTTVLMVACCLTNAWQVSRASNHCDQLTVVCDSHGLLMCRIPAPPMGHQWLHGSSVLPVREQQLALGLNSGQLDQQVGLPVSCLVHAPPDVQLGLSCCITVACTSSPGA